MRQTTAERKMAEISMEIDAIFALPDPPADYEGYAALYKLTVVRHRYYWRLPQKYRASLKFYFVKRLEERGIYAEKKKSFT